MKLFWSVFKVVGVCISVGSLIQGMFPLATYFLLCALLCQVEEHSCK
jgi:hypothetical protein